MLVPNRPEHQRRAGINSHNPRHVLWYWSDNNTSASGHCSLNSVLFGVRCAPSARGCCHRLLISISAVYYSNGSCSCHFGISANRILLSICELRLFISPVGRSVPFRSVPGGSSYSYFYLIPILSNSINYGAKLRECPSKWEIWGCRKMVAFNLPLVVRKEEERERERERWY